MVGCGKDVRRLLQPLATHGMEVAFEPTEEQITNAFRRIEEKRDRRIKGWGLTENEKKVIMSRIKGTMDYILILKDVICDCHPDNALTGERRMFNEVMFSENSKACLPPMLS